MNTKLLEPLIFTGRCVYDIYESNVVVLRDELVLSIVDENTTKACLWRGDDRLVVRIQEDCPDILLELDIIEGYVEDGCLMTLGQYDDMMEQTRINNIFNNI